MSVAPSGSGYAPDTEPPYFEGADRGAVVGAAAEAAASAAAAATARPPQDNDAEQSVLGSMLLSKDAIADVIESVRGGDFYRPAHETIYDAIDRPLRPRRAGRPGHRRRPSCSAAASWPRVGGAPYLHTLSASVPIAANAGYYAEIVREKAILRRLVDAGTRIAQMGYAGEGQVDDIVDRAQAEVYGVTEKRPSEDYAPLSAIMEATLDEIEAISNRDGEHGRRADRLRRPRRADQRPARRPDGHRRGPARDRASRRSALDFCRAGVDPQQPDQRDLLAWR